LLHLLYIPFDYALLLKVYYRPILNCEIKLNLTNIFFKIYKVCLQLLYKAYVAPPRFIRGGVCAIQEISGYRGQATVRRHSRGFTKTNWQHTLEIEPHTIVNWISHGWLAAPYSGIFDGDHHTISSQK